MPKLECWCDRYWNPLRDCRMPGVSAAQLPLPFHCPFDHLYDLEKWVHSPVPFREYSFLDNRRVAERDRRDKVTLRVDGAAETAAAAPAAAATNVSARVLTARPGDNYAAVAQALGASGWDGAYVVHVSARSLELLCEDLGSPAANKEFNGIMHTVLGVAEQACFFDEPPLLPSSPPSPSPSPSPACSVSPSRCASATRPRTRRTA